MKIRDALHSILLSDEVSAIFDALEFARDNKEEFIMKHGRLQWENVEIMANAYRRQMEE